MELAPGEQGCSALLIGEVGQVLRDQRCGSNPFQVRGPRGESAWFRGESLLRSDQDTSTLVCSRGHLLCEWSGRQVVSLEPATCERCTHPISRQQPRWRCDMRTCSHSVCARCFKATRWERKTEIHEPLIVLVQRTLNPQVHLDFPTLRGICEAAAQQPTDAELAAGLLVATLGDQALKPGDMRNVTQDYLKVLTIFYEMVNDQQVVAVLQRTPGLQDALGRLRAFRAGDMGDSADENIRMLANEVDRAVFSSGRSYKPSGRTEITGFCPNRHLLKWKAGQSVFHVVYASCAMCQREMPRTTERYACRICNYQVCVACLRRGAK